MSKDELKSMLKYIRSKGSITEGEAYVKWCQDETSNSRSKVLSALYTMESKGLLVCIREGELRHFMPCIPDTKLQ